MRPTLTPGLLIHSYQAKFVQSMRSLLDTVSTTVNAVPFVAFRRHAHLTRAALPSCYLPGATAVAVLLRVAAPVDTADALCFLCDRHVRAAIKALDVRSGTCFASLGLPIPY